MDGLTVVFGSGATGRPVIEMLAARGDRVRVAQRGAPTHLPAGVTHVPCDVLDADAVLRAVSGASQVVLAVAFPYDARVWRTAWPKAMTNVLAGCVASGARLVFIDNLYQLGPQDVPRREDMPLSDISEKLAILSEITRMWLAARDQVRTAALRCPDFYGPGVGHSHLGALAFGELAKGKPAQLLVPPDTLHDFAYVPDIARAVVTLLDAPDDAFGRPGTCRAHRPGPRATCSRSGRRRSGSATVSGRCRCGCCDRWASSTGWHKRWSTSASPGTDLTRSMRARSPAASTSSPHPSPMAWLLAAVSFAKDR